MRVSHGRRWETLIKSSILKPPSTSSIVTSGGNNCTLAVMHEKRRETQYV